MSKPRYPQAPRIARQRRVRSSSPTSRIPASSELAATRSLPARPPRRSLAAPKRCSSRGSPAIKAAVAQARTLNAIVGPVGTLPANKPVNSSGPSTAAQAKLGMLVSTKKQTLRRAMISLGIPSW